MTSTDIYTIPYTYLITHIPTDKKYYGVRFAKGCNPSDLWLTYFTSSKYVKSLIKDYGIESFNIEIRKIFNSVEKARKWETKVLKRMSVSKRDDYINKTDNISIPPLFGLDNASSKLEVKKRISEGLLKYYETHDNARKGKPGHLGSDKQKQAVSKSSSERVWSEESLLKLSVSQTGLKKPPLSINHKQKISEFQKGKPKLKIQCPHCDVIGGVNTMGRWHFDNCTLRR